LSIFLQTSFSIALKILTNSSFLKNLKADFISFPFSLASPRESIFTELFTYFSNSKKVLASDSAFFGYVSLDIKNSKDLVKLPNAFGLQICFSDLSFDFLKIAKAKKLFKRFEKI
jgi:hypothetical protein